MQIVHLTASTLFGGPERQMLGLAEHLPPQYVTTFVSFCEHRKCEPFLAKVREHGFDGFALEHDTPYLRTATDELTELLTDRGADILLCHGYKSNLVGRLAARRLGIPVVAVSRGWTWENLKVRMYETVDRLHLRFMDHVVCVSEGQAQKVRRTGVRNTKLSIIRNSAQVARFKEPRPDDRAMLLQRFPKPETIDHVIIAAGRLSPEKGFDLLVEAARRMSEFVPRCGLLLFGEGDERSALQARIDAFGMTERFIMPGFTATLDGLLPVADLVVLPSRTEGLPNVALEASSAGIAVVATNVGGNPEAVEDGVTGMIIPPENIVALADAMTALLTNPQRRHTMGEAGRQRMRDEFSFDRQAADYVQLLHALTPSPLGERVGMRGKASPNSQDTSESASSLSPSPPAPLPWGRGAQEKNNRARVPI